MPTKIWWRWTTTAVEIRTRGVYTLTADGRFYILTTRFDSLRA
jgi:hypothetical protein